MERSLPQKPGRPGGKAGFTLVELMVVLAIAGLVVAVSGSLIVTGTNIFSRSAQRDMQTTIAESVLRLATDQMLYAAPIETGAFRADIPCMRVGEDGRLYFSRSGDSDEVDVFGPSFYHGNTVSMALGVYPPGSGDDCYFVLEVTVLDPRGQPAVKRSATRPLLNYHGLDEPMAIGSGDYILLHPFGGGGVP